MENKKKIIIIFIALIALIIVAGSTNKNKKNKLDNARNVFTIKDSQISDESIQKIKEELIQDFEKSLEVSKEEFDKDIRHFEIYFDTPYFNLNMTKGRSDYITINQVVDNDNPEKPKVDIYNLNGEELEEFPKEILYSKNSTIETNTNYLLRLMSYEEDYCFYYTININQYGQASLKKICYTIGEQRPVEEVF